VSDHLIELLAEEVGALRVVRVRGKEAASRLFSFDVLVALEGKHPPQLGARATLSIRGEGTYVRRVHGVVDAIGFEEHANGRNLARVRLRPRLVRLRRRRTRRVFQDRTTLEIAALVLLEWALPMSVVVAHALPRRPYSVQYDETDLAFLERLFAEDGLFYGFEHGEDANAGEVLLVAARVADLSGCEGLVRLPFEPAAASAAAHVGEDVAIELAWSTRSVPGRARVRGYDHRRPNAFPEDVAGAPALETIDAYEESYEDDLPLRPASARLDAAVARGETVMASTYSRRLEPLRRIELELGDAPRELVVTRVEHEAYDGAHVPPGKTRYQNRARLAPATRPPRPKRATARPRQVSEIAVVVGPKDAEIHTDELGRVKVQFPWDREGKLDETSSAWLRVLSPWAGAGWGVHFTPRVGMEVLVTFVGGDVDRPIVAGALPNAHTAPPFVGSHAGIRTRSTPNAAAFNEVSFDDTHGSERLLLTASRNLIEQVGSERASRVGGSRTSEIAGADHTEVGLRHSVDVKGERAASVGGDDRVDVKGARVVRVEQDVTTTVHGSENLHVDQDRSVTVRGRMSSVVGDPERAGHREDYVYGSLGVGADKDVTLHSKARVLLRVGDSSIELKHDRIVITSPTIELAASKGISVVKPGGAALSIGDEVELLTKALRVFTEKGALELDSDFKVRGASIKLGYDPSKPKPPTGGENVETVTLKLNASNEDLEPLVGCTYHVVVGTERFEGVTTADGGIEVEVPKDATGAVVRVWERDYPTGRSQVYALALGELPSASSVSGAKVRLRNLGYYDGPIDDLVTPAFRKATRAFQVDHQDSHDLSPTGDLDGPTASAVEDVHKS